MEVESPRGGGGLWYNNMRGLSLASQCLDPTKRLGGAEGRGGICWRVRVREAMPVGLGGGGGEGAWVGEEGARSGGEGRWDGGEGSRGGEGTAESGEEEGLVGSGSMAERLGSGFGVKGVGSRGG
ncbi:uncharacterized protein LOC133795519 [Humulus lupulus]|uniref:uncharacterized protein LOC133795519 n=1 Tax=Humulus lupulus TaxID=3486 RepID=UPI002B409FEB|nr:uncharacterized protein LOC133795519 [Humulus lupulus]